MQQLCELRIWALSLRKLSHLLYKVQETALMVDGIFKFLRALCRLSSIKMELIPRGNEHGTWVQNGNTVQWHEDLNEAEEEHPLGVCVDIWEGTINGNNMNGGLSDDRVGYCPAGLPHNTMSWMAVRADT